MKKKIKISNDVCYIARMLKFGNKGEKTGWTYIEVPADVAEKLCSGTKKSFRVKGALDELKISGIALIPMGDGNFILPVNANMRKGLGKRDGGMIRVSLKYDSKKPALSNDLLECLEDETEAFTFFKSLSYSHQNYFSKWIEGAKTPETKANRIARTINALQRKMNYGEMLREKINR